MDRKTFILTLLSPILSVFGWKPNFLKREKFKFDPILISLVRKSFPNLVAKDLCAIPPIITKPVGLYYKYKPKYDNKSDLSLFE